VAVCLSGLQSASSIVSPVFRVILSAENRGATRQGTEQEGDYHRRRPLKFK
jgi:hypothetical protein